MDPDSILNEARNVVGDQLRAENFPSCIGQMHAFLSQARHGDRVLVAVITRDGQVRHLSLAPDPHATPLEAAMSDIAFLEVIKGGINKRIFPNDACPLGGTDFDAPSS